MPEPTFATHSNTSSGNEHPWWKSAVFYEAYVDKFAGDFRGFAKRLEYLEKLGITCIHLLPFYPSPMVDDGYDITDYLSVRPELGTLEDFAHFVGEAHARGIRVMIDFVLNHVSTGHPWFIEASSSAKNSKRGYFHWSKTGTEFALAENPFPDIKASNWTRNEKTGDYYFATFYPSQADLNWHNPEVFGKMMQIVDFWAGLGVDAFRLDAAKFIAKREGTACKNLPETHEMLKRIRAHIDTIRPGIVLLGEAHEPIEIIKEYFGDGDECHLMYHFPMVEQLFLGLLRGERKGVDAMAAMTSGIPASCGWATFLRHHDEMSFATLAPEARQELLGHFDPESKYHFSTGSSMRLATMFRGSIDKTIEAYKLLLSIPGSPIVYYGDEIGMANAPIPEDEPDSRKSLRAPFDWAAAIIAERNPASLFNRLSALLNAHKAQAEPLRMPHPPAQKARRKAQAIKEPA